MIAKYSVIINGVLYRKGQEIPIDEPEPTPEPQPEPEPQSEPEPQQEPEPEIEEEELPSL